MDHSFPIKNFIVTEFMPDIHVGQLDSDYDLVAGGVIDSLGLLRVVTWLEAEFDLPIDEVEVHENDFTSVASMCQFVQRARRRCSVAEKSDRG